jgi:hypothetical protein
MSKLHLGISLLPRKEREQSKPLGSECFMNSLIFIGIIRKSTKMFETRRNQAHFSENLTHQARIVCLSGLNRGSRKWTYASNSLRRKPLGLDGMGDLLRRQFAKTVASSVARDV